MQCKRRTQYLRTFSGDGVSGELRNYLAKEGMGMEEWSLFLTSYYLHFLLGCFCLSVPNLVGCLLLQDFPSELPRSSLSLEQFCCVQVSFYKTLHVPAKVSPLDQGNCFTHIGNIIHSFFFIHLVNQYLLHTCSLQFAFEEPEI